MNITSKGRYALQVMLDLAQHREEGYISLKTVADRQGYSMKYLEMIVGQLKKAELLSSTRGKEGGYKLNRPPEDYTVGEILKAVEGDLIPVACLAKDGKKCTGNCTCYTFSFWNGLAEQINAYVDSYTLKDLLDDKEKTHCCCGDFHTDNQ